MKFYKQNNLMRDCVVKLNKKKKLKYIPVDMAHFAKYFVLQNLINIKDLILLEGCIHSRDIKRLMGEDTCKWCAEYFWNHVHVINEFEQPNKGKYKGLELLYVAFSIAEIYRLKLKTQFPDDKFQIEISFPVKTKDDAIVRFCKIREEEKNSIKRRNKLEYKEHAIGILRT